MYVSTSTPSEDNEIATVPKKVSSAVKRDQQAEAMSLTVPLNPSQISEYTDPAILAAKPSVVRYAREKLVELRQVPLAQKRPDYLDVAYNNTNGIWDPELWHRSRYEGTNENGDLVYKRRPGDPRDRLRKEDGIVLSPQRRSFNNGCYVPLKENQRSIRSHSPVSGKSESNIGPFRDIPPGGRRIGSGRILSRDVPWDFQEKEGDEFPYRKERRDSDRDERFERRSYGRDFELGKDKHGSRNGRFPERRRIDSREEEPEWFSAGPISQHETIELRGFDDVENDKLAKTKKPVPKKRKERKNSEQNENKQLQPVDEADRNDKSIETVIVDQENNIPSDTSKITTEEKFNNADQNMFNLDDFLKCDTIAGLLTNGVDSGGGDAGSSRFSQFFTRESPKHTDSRRSSFQDDNIIRNVLNDITEPNVSIPNDSELYFAPISPAASTGISGHNVQHSVQKPVNIMEMLRGKQSTREVPAAKVVSLEELEARILQQGRTEPMPNVRMPSKSENDSAAFERLVAQMKGNHVVTNNGPVLSKMPPITSLIEALQDEKSHNSQMLGPVSPNPLHNELAFKLQQVQNHVQAQQRQQAQLDMMSKLMNASLHRQQFPTSPLPDMGINQSRELLNRPEAQAILQVMHQRIPSPRELQQHTQAIMQNALIKKKLEEQQENYKRRQEQHSTGRGLSPAKHASSPTPLAFTPTSVLRKMTADKDDGCTKTSAHGRAVTGMKPNILQSQSWNLQQHLKQPGRPIVKANASLQAQQPPHGQHDLQQFYQQQRLYGQQQSRKLGSQQFPLQSGASSSSHQSHHNYMHHQHQFSSNNQQFQHQHLTQHQLRAQHQQHQPPLQTPQPSQFGNKLNPQQHWPQQHHQMLTGHNYDNRSLHLIGDRGGASNNGGELSPIANQLARWFPPELLEKARAGKVPSMPNSTLAQHAVNLEEMERHTAPPIHN